MHILRIVYKRVFDTVHHALKEDIFNSFAETKKSEPTETIEEIKLDLDNNYINDKIDEPLIQNKVEPSINDIYNNIYSNITINNNYKKEELYNKLKKINKNKRISSINNFINDDNEKYNSSFNENNIVNPDNNNGNSHISNINSQFSSSDITYDNTQNQAISTESIKSESKAKFPDLRIIGQFNKTYILAEYADTLYIIDQHAAHEKILYEKYSKDIENGEIVVQQLLLPCLIDLSLDDYECYNENKDIYSGLLLIWWKYYFIKRRICFRQTQANYYFIY